jgi:hypothetical protein
MDFNKKMGLWGGKEMTPYPRRRSRREMTGEKTTTSETLLASHVSFLQQACYNTTGCIMLVDGM